MLVSFQELMADKGNSIYLFISVIKINDSFAKATSAYQRNFTLEEVYHTPSYRS